MYFLHNIDKIIYFFKKQKEIFPIIKGFENDWEKHDFLMIS